MKMLFWSIYKQCIKEFDLNLPLPSSVVSSSAATAAAAAAFHQRCHNFSPNSIYHSFFQRSFPFSSFKKTKSIKKCKKVRFQRFSDGAIEQVHVRRQYSLKLMRHSRKIFECHWTVVLVFLYIFFRDFFSHRDIALFTSASQNRPCRRNPTNRSECRSFAVCKCMQMGFPFASMVDNQSESLGVCVYWCNRYRCNCRKIILRNIHSTYFFFLLPLQLSKTLCALHKLVRARSRSSYICSFTISLSCDSSSFRQGNGELYVLCLQMQSVVYVFRATDFPQKRTFRFSKRRHRDFIKSQVIRF